MAAEYVRRHYGVPAKRGMRVITCSGPGRVTSFDGQCVRVLLDDIGYARHGLPFHPTWQMTYLDADGKVLASYAD